MLHCVRVQMKGMSNALLPLLVSRGLAANKSATFTVAVDSAVLLCALDGVSPATAAALVAGLKNGKVKKGQTGCARIIAAVVSRPPPTPGAAAHLLPPPPRWHPCPAAAGSRESVQAGLGGLGRLPATAVAGGGASTT